MPVLTVVPLARLSFLSLELAVAVLAVVAVDRSPSPSGLDRSDRGVGRFVAVPVLHRPVAKQVEGGAVPGDLHSGARHGVVRLEAPLPDLQSNIPAGMSGAGVTCDRVDVNSS